MSPMAIAQMRFRVSIFPSNIAFVFLRVGKGYGSRVSVAYRLLKFGRSVIDMPD